MSRFPLHPPGDFPEAAAAAARDDPPAEPNAAEVAQAVARAVRRHRYRFDDEKQLQAAIAMVLEGDGLPYAREALLAPGDVADFLVAGCVAVEVKVGGGLSDVTRQLHRYAAHEAIGALVLVTSLARLANQPETFRGKPLEVVVVSGAFS
jgi:hypothetical protein